MEISLKQKNKDPLTEEERICIIEELLKKYTKLINSILHLSTSLYLEQFKLLDATYENYNGDVSGEDTLIMEYLKSNYAKLSDDKVFRNLKRVYDFFHSNITILKHRDIKIRLLDLLNVFEEKDLIYYTENYILRNKRGYNKVELVNDYLYILDPH